MRWCKHSRPLVGVSSSRSVTWKHRHMSVCMQIQKSEPFFCDWTYLWIINLCPRRIRQAGAMSHLIIEAISRFIFCPFPPLPLPFLLASVCLGRRSLRDCEPLKKMWKLPLVYLAKRSYRAQPLWAHCWQGKINPDPPCLLRCFGLRHEEQRVALRSTCWTRLLAANHTLLPALLGCSSVCHDEKAEKWHRHKYHMFSWILQQNGPLLISVIDRGHCYVYNLIDVSPLQNLSSSPSPEASTRFQTQ